MTKTEARKILELHKRWREAGARLPFPEHVDFLAKVREADECLAPPRTPPVEYTTVRNKDGTISPGVPVE